MATTKTDVTSNKPTTTDLIQVASGEKVLAEVENQNNLLNLNAIILAYNWIIDSGVELTAANVFTAAQEFSAGLKTGAIDPLTTNGNITITTGSGYTRFDTTGNVYKGSVVAGNALQTLTEVQTEISTTVGAGIDLIYGDVQTSNFNAVVGTIHPINTTGGAFTGTLPATATDGDIIGFVDNFGASVTYNFTIGRNGNEIMGVADDLDCNVNYFAVYLIFKTDGWYLI